MRRSFIALSALVLVLVPLASSVAEGIGPRAVPVEPVVDFEIVPKGETIHHVFEIANEGDAPLELTDVKPACGCTVAKFDRVIPPGKTGYVTIKLETANFGGPISKPVAVFTNDPENPKIQLVAKAEIRPYLGMNPGYARFIYVQGEQLRPIPQVLWAEDGSDIHVVGVKSPYEHLSVKYREASEEERDPDHAGMQWAFDVELDPNAPVGALRDYVEVTVDHPKQKTMRIPISGFVRPRQHVTPQKIDFGVLDGEALPLQRVVDFTNFITKGIEVTSTESGIEGLSVRVEQVGRRDGHRFKLMLTVGPEIPKGEFKSVLKLHITDEQTQVVEVPISGTIL